MATTDGPAAPALTQLTRVIREYSLFQAVLRVIQRLRDAHPLLDDDTLYDLLEFQANPSLGFPGDDIDRVAFFVERGQLRARLRLNVLGLCGAGSPLPAFYGEQACADESGGNATRDFLDVFHHRLQRLMLPIWRKYRYRACFKAGASDAFSEQMFALIGLRGRQVRSVTQLNGKRLLPYLGLLGLRAHSAALIETLLRYYFKHCRVIVEQWVLRSVVIAESQRNRLGAANSALGHDQVLGSQVADRNGKFRVHLQGLGWHPFHGFLPTGTDYPLLCSLVRLTVRDPMDYDLRLVMDKDEIRPLHIGEHNVCRLGWTSWLAHECADGVVIVPGNAY
ncbi:type VI secretion protein [Pseudomonas azotoformans]|uniref:Type VI secretion protein n=1 Tax=Pseudomonas azotoformans TaxID=47878 RepID=A0A1V2JGM0_PSEAZ|nr:type VI secretion system baseplate subunit TssG [Pseudomonas azotoformans]OIN51749.1 type VI secretion protein [Pseudomonas azotoformans]ONH44425.1 type VI secretion protein [Pseudomonas azotoformans]SDN29461.1 type VI secretion system protein ImpH [Pseudomonas azotoformans]